MAQDAEKWRDFDVYPDSLLWVNSLSLGYSASTETPLCSPGGSTFFNAGLRSLIVSSYTIGLRCC